MKNTKTPAGRLLLAGLVLLGLLAAPLHGAEMTGRQAGKVLKEAQTAVAKGDTVMARELFQLIAASTPKAPKQRAEALYALILLEAATPAAARDEASLENSSVQFLEQFPRHEKRPVVAALAGLMADSKATQSELAALEAKIAATELAQKETTAAGAKDASKKMEELEARLRRSGAEVEILKAELAKKDEALKKLKAVAVGGG